MSSKIWIWKNVPGIAGRCDDIIYSSPILPSSQDVLLYFGGDIQVHKMLCITKLNSSIKQ